MSRHLENTDNWDLYQVVIKELATNGCIDIRESQWSDYIEPDENGKRVNRLGPPLAHLCRPGSHDARLRLGLTVPGAGTTCRGAIVRIGQGQYCFERNLLIRDRDTLVTDDDTVRRYNANNWMFESPNGNKEAMPPAPEPVSEPAPAKAAQLDTLQVIARTQVPPLWIVSDGEATYVLQEVEQAS